jgi:hypothetical protein
MTPGLFIKPWSTGLFTPPWFQPGGAFCASAVALPKPMEASKLVVNNSFMREGI